MNAERLRSVVDFLLQSEQNHRIQKRLSALNSAVANLVSDPGNVEHQKAMAEGLTALTKVLQEFWEPLTPAQQKDVSALNAYPFFSTSMTDEVRASISTNAMTPVVVQQRVNEITTLRQQFLDTLTNVAKALDALGVVASALDPGEAELGVLLPRDLYDNDLDEFQSELKKLIFILRTFSEISNQRTGKIKLRQISMSDPILFLGIDVTTLILFGIAVKWCIDTIRSAIEIKNVAGLARKASVSETKVAALEEEVNDMIDRQIEAKAKEMLDNYGGKDVGRKNELEQAASKGLRLLLERVERGVTVEIRLLPPAVPSEEEKGKKPDPAAQQFSELQAIAKQLEFPKVPDQKALQLTTADVDNDAKPAS